ncbi:MAG: hypothetical protein AAB568_00535 [Patescibacteria group bacterium]
MRNPESNFFEPLRESAVSKVVGGGAEERRVAGEFYKNIFENQPTARWEREKTVEEFEAIAEINENLKKFVGNYGGQWLEIKPENIHIIDLKKLNKEQRDEAPMVRWNAYYDSDKQGIVMFAEGGLPCFYQNLLHEMLHLNSFNSFDLSKQTVAGRGVDRRTGLNVYVAKDKEELEKGQKSYFSDLDEAVIAELQIRFTKKFLGGDFEPSYAAERKFLKSLIKKIYEKNRGEFESKEEVFKLFADATISGRLLPLARAVEKTFGKGYFRDLGALTQTRNKLGLDNTTINLDDI